MNESLSESAPGRCSRWWLPTIGRTLWLAFFLALTLSNWRLVLISADGDPCLHWRIGNWMIEHRAVIRVDQFSHTRTGAPLVSKEWLSEVLFASAGNALGWNGIVLLSAGLIATTLWLLYRQLLAEGNELVLSMALVLAAAFACSVHWLARPHLMTHLLAVVFAWRLRAYYLGREPVRWLFVTLVPLMALWANLHGAFAAGLVLVGVYCFGSVLERNWSNARTFALLTVACLLASLANPNGWKLHIQILSFLQTSELSGFANEFRSPNFHSGSTHGFSLELLILALTLLVVRPQWRATEILMIGVWGYLALHSVRNVPIFALVVSPIIAAPLDQFLRKPRDAAWARLYQKFSTDTAALDRAADGRWLAVIAVALLGVVVTRTNALKTELLPDRFPVAALEKFVKSGRANVLLHGEMFNAYGWGGYLMLELPERKVFIDGRNDFYGSDLVEEFNTVDDVKPGWEHVLDKYNVGWTLLPLKHRLNGLLALHKDWTRVYEDDVAVIYSRKQSLHPFNESRPGRSDIS
jgi:hypothetical protein